MPSTCTGIPPVYRSTANYWQQQLPVVGSIQISRAVVSIYGLYKHLAGSFKIILGWRNNWFMLFFKSRDLIPHWDMFLCVPSSRWQLVEIDLSSLEFQILPYLLQTFKYSFIIMLSLMCIIHFNLTKRLFAGTVPANNTLFDGTFLRLTPLKCS